jgi:hypothetical protein
MRKIVLNSNNAYGFGDFDKPGQFKLLRGRTIKNKSDNFKQQISLLSKDPITMG